MSFKFNPKEAEGRKYISQPGVYDVVVQSWEEKYMPPVNDFYVKFTLEAANGEVTNADIFVKQEKNGSYSRLNQFIAATATQAEIEKYLAKGEFEVDEEFVRTVAQRAVGRALKVEVTAREYTKKNGEKGVAHNGSFFRRLKDGPEKNPF